MFKRLSDRFWKWQETHLVLSAILFLGTGVFFIMLVGAVLAAVGIAVVLGIS